MRPPTRIEMEDFKTILNHEIQVHNNIERYLSRKKDVIIKGDLDALTQVDNALESLTQQARELEKERLAIMVQMGREGETMKAFLKSLKTGEDTEILAHAREQLAVTTQEIKKLSLTNRDLLTQSIRFIEQSVEVIATMLAPEGSAYTNLRINRHGGPDTGMSKPGHVSSTINHNA